MHNSVKNLLLIKEQISKYKSNIEIIAVSKTFNVSKIMPLVEFGHLHFGENKVQEAQDKWPIIVSKYKDLKLHMIGKLQTNKVKSAVRIFDYIHSVDTKKLAKKISEEQKKINRNLKLFIQINVGNESQKGGVLVSDLQNFYNYLIDELKVNVVGLMCIPPVNSDTIFFFEEMKKINSKIGLKELSMGMSSDYIQAANHSSTFVRIGSKIFGTRD